MVPASVPPAAAGIGSGLSAAIRPAASCMSFPAAPSNTTMCATCGVRGRIRSNSSTNSASMKASLASELSTT
jgi:hypothetical protein